MPAFFIVNTVSDTPVEGKLTLRQAINQANAAGGNDTIIFAAPLANATISIQSQLPEITDTLTIDGNVVVPVAGGEEGGPVPQNYVTIQRDAAPENPYRLFQVDLNSSATMSNLKLLNGRTTANGGAIYSEGDLTLRKCEVRGNNALTGTGGAIDVRLGKLEIYDSAINGNNAALGGGIHFAGKQMIMADSVVGLNHALIDGGGLFLEQSFEDVDNTVTLRDHTAMNHAASLGF